MTAKLSYSPERRSARAAARSAAPRSSTSVSACARREKNSIGGEARGLGMHKMPHKPRLGVEPHTSAVARRAQAEGPGRVTVTMPAGALRAPSARGGQRRPTVVAEVAPGNLFPGIAVRERQATQSEDRVQDSAPNDAKALVHMCRQVFAFHAGDTAAPGGRVSAGELHPAGKGHRAWDSARVAPMQVEEGAIARKGAGPTRTTLKEVIGEAQQGLWPVAQKGRQQPYTRSPVFSGPDLGKF